MHYSCVIVTRNRQDALVLSLPGILRQTRPPEEIIVVDSSDDGSAILALVEQLRPTTAVPIRYLRSAPGMTHQRNIGLAQVTTEVVLFPDDDSLLHPEAMAHVMRIYERDGEGLIGGVCTVEALQPHESFGLATAAPNSYRRRRLDGIALAVAPLRHRLEARLAPDPFRTLAAEKLGRLRLPDWLAEARAITVPYMTGFRMSYRTEVIRRLGFDEGLGRYALFEDVDASLRVLDSHCLVAALDASIYHHKAPERRDAGRAMGTMHILNRAYVLAKDRTEDPGAWARIRGQAGRFAAYKTWLYRMRAKGAFGQDRLQGARLAAASQAELFSVPRSEVAATYARIKDRCLTSRGDAIGRTQLS